MKNLINKIRELIKKYSAPKTLRDKVMAVAVVFFIVLIVVSHTLLSRPVTQRLQTNKESNSSDVGVLGDEVNSKIFVENMEKDYYELKQNLDELTRKTNADIEKLSSDQKFIGEFLEEKVVKRLDKIEKDLQGAGDAGKILKGLDLNKLSQGLLGQPSQAMTLEHVDILPVDKSINEEKYVHLPMGSFCRGTLMTGVHAPSDETNPLPVLIRLDEAFIGPNQSRIPLKGTFLLGSAYGDMVSRRAYIEIYGVSTVLPDGKSYEKSMPSMGYIGDSNHHFGIEGVVINPTGKELGLSFLAGFMSGASQAFADSETTSVVGAEGAVTRAVTGNATKNATFQGLSASAANLSGHYQEQIDKIIPSIKIEPGVEVYFYVQKGITIDGLKIVDHDHVSFVD